MEKRIKLLHAFTILAILAFCITQYRWLHTRYGYTLQEYRDGVYRQVLALMQQELDTRRSRPDPVPVALVTRSQILANSGREHGVLTWVFEIYAADGNRYPLRDSADSERIVRLYGKEGSGISKYRFTVEDRPNERDVYTALDRFCTDLRHPFSGDSLQSLLEKSGLHVSGLSVERRDTMVWEAECSPRRSVSRPGLTVTYPFDVFDGEVVRMDFEIGISPILKQMSSTLCVTALLSLLLVTCLLAQIRTIYRQRRTDSLRKEFIHTMIHELKRPVSTLKMSVSFMRNEKLMQDLECRDAVLADACRELDNLSAYFARLRDLSFDDITEIPLHPATFSLETAVRECIAKLNISGGKQADIRIVSKQDLSVTADRMHLMNIVSNLLENAVKYSGKTVEIEIGYRTENGTTVITVKDNGIGIPKSEIPYIFDKFYRGRAAYDRLSPGLGLGLAYVKLLVTAHNGKITVNSEEGNGTVFDIRLPRHTRI